MTSVAELESLGHPLQGGPSRILAILRAYLDESGIHEGAEICSIAGYFGKRRAWEKLETRWVSILKEFKVPEFHANCFWSRDDKGQRVKPYVGWSDLRAEDFLNKLLRTIKDSRIYPVGSAVIGKEWAGLTIAERRYLTGAEMRSGKFKTTGSPGKSYFLPFLQAVQRVARYCKGNERAYFFFGLDRTFSGYALNYYQDLVKLKYDWTSHLGDIGFPRAIDTAPLQAADLLSYKVYQYALERLENWNYSIESCPELASALARVRNPDDDFKLYDKRSLDAALQDFRQQYPELCSKGHP